MSCLRRSQKSIQKNILKNRNKKADLDDGADYPDTQNLGNLDQIMAAVFAAVNAYNITDVGNTAFLDIISDRGMQF
ncbi:hypothetical protein SAMN05216349_10442 [Oribacterium sp. KHPX15]|nr:hypothetical protein SAMN05216349_10442 [Oribacterium sp. KHPX15]